jgi:cyclophilin family peptidyl-prolyl cis-trans isomerase
MVVVAAVAVGVSGCGGGAKTAADGEAPVRQTSISVDSELVELVFLEGERGFARERIAELALSGAPAARGRAIRALGRLGDPQSEEVLASLLTDEDVSIRVAAAHGLAIAGAEGVEEALADQFRNAAASDAKAAYLFALGRVGSTASIPVFVAALADSDPSVVEAGGVGLAMFGRRKLALDDGARAALVAALASDVESVRYAAAYAFAREHEPGDDAGAISALTALVDVAAPETAALAVYALAKRDAAGPVVPTAITHSDWRVRVQAARALGSVAADEMPNVAVRLVREWAALAAEGMTSPSIHVVTEGLHALAVPEVAASPQVNKIVNSLYEAASERLEEESHNVVLAASTVHCGAAAVLVAGGAGVELLTGCGGATDRGMPVFARRALLVGVLSNGSVVDAKRREYVLTLLAGDSDARVRAVGVDAAAALVKADVMRERALELIEQGLADEAIPVSGSAAGAVATLAGTLPDVVRPLHASLVSRAESGSEDMELLSSLITALAATKADGGAPTCQAARFHANVSIRDAARKCTEAYTGTDPGYADADAAPARLDVSPAGLLGKNVTWVVETTKGSVIMELDADTAPWHVAVIMSLVDKGVYDGVIFHRVVPDFVVQGGDPTGSGWGGPGFVVPGEPSMAPYTAGAVGIADAGMDTGGSQWFIMHSRASHLDARYTHIGVVTRGQDVVDSLVVGDRILSARVDVVERE